MDEGFGLDGHAVFQNVSTPMHGRRIFQGRCTTKETIVAIFIQPARELGSVTDRKNRCVLVDIHKKNAQIEMQL